jgi:tRNA(Ile)-lysidine synthase
LKQADFAQLLDALPKTASESRSKVGVALSGGPDSMALAFLMNESMKSKGGQAIAFIIDHGLRPESSKEAQQTADEVKSWGMEAHISKLEWADGVPNTGNLQEKARIARAMELANLARLHRTKYVRNMRHMHACARCTVSTCAAKCSSATKRMTWWRHFCSGKLV